MTRRTRSLCIAAAAFYLALLVGLVLTRTNPIVVNILAGVMVFTVYAFVLAMFTAGAGTSGPAPTPTAEDRRRAIDEVNLAYDRRAQTRRVVSSRALL